MLIWGKAAAGPGRDKKIQQHCWCISIRVHSPPSSGFFLLASVCLAFHFLVSPVSFPGSSLDGHCSDYSARLFLKTAEYYYYREDSLRSSTSEALCELLNPNEHCPVTSPRSGVLNILTVLEVHLCSALLGFLTSSLPNSILYLRGGGFLLFLHTYKGCQCSTVSILSFQTLSLWTTVFVLFCFVLWCVSMSISLIGLNPNKKGNLLISASPLPSSVRIITGFQ